MFSPSGIALVTVVATLCVVSETSLAASTVADLALHTIDAESFGPDILHFRVQHKRSNPYRVTDVVVANPDASITVACAAPNAQCSATTSGLGASFLLTQDNARITISDARTGDDTVVVADIPLREGALEGTFAFPQAAKLYGIPEHAIDLALKPGNTYRLMNLDVFQYKLDDNGGIYGTIPFLMAHGSGRTVGMLWLNSADSKVEVNNDANSGAPNAKFIGEGDGIVDVYVFAGRSPVEVMRQHAKLTGPTMLPPQFALGYHQCRWNYRSTTDCLEVDAGFDTHNIPYDVLWLDIEHTDGKRYFTWDNYNFAEPKKLIDTIASHGRKMVTITDPHIKRDDNYHVHKEATQQGYYVKTEGGSDFEGHCWPGQSSWVDFYNAKARAWYATLFKYDRYPGSTPDLYTWIDMNEPSVFNAHEVTMDKNAVHSTADGVKVRHRDVHNMYGYYHTMAAHQGHILRNEPKPTRPFILTRSFFAGSQRYAAMWTGDNAAEWSHLVKSIPMLLTLSISNYAFVGADVGGFFGNPEAELMVRWYQAGAFYPFFRGHAHLETKRREPWLFGEETTKHIREAIVTRYRLMPYIYSTFFRAHDLGTSFIRPLFVSWPEESRFFEEQTAFMMGDGILVRPITDKGATSVTVPLPTSSNWFNLFTGEAVSGPTYTMSGVTLDTIPAFVEGGRIIPTRTRLRRSTSAMRNDPITLIIAVNDKGNAAGELYLDDGNSFDFEKGAFALKRFSYSNGVLSCDEGAAASTKRISGLFSTSVKIERVIFYGLSKVPARVSVTESSNPSIDGVAVPLRVNADVHVAKDGNMVILRAPDVFVDASWTIKLE